MTASSELFELIQIQEARLRATERQVKISRAQAEADLLREQNEVRRLDQRQWALRREERRLKVEERRNAMIEEVLAWMRTIRDGHHEPIMRGIKCLDEKTGALVQILNIAVPVLLKDKDSDPATIEQVVRLLSHTMEIRQGSQVVNVGTNIQSDGNLTTQDITGGNKHE